MEPHISKYESQSYNLEEEYYIEDDFLSKNIDLCSIEGSKDAKYNLQFCMFVINKECFIEGVNEKVVPDLFLYFDKFFPFLQFYMKKIDGVYQFPQMEFACPIQNKTIEAQELMIGGEDEIPQSQIYFENECFRFLTSFFEDAGIIHSLPPNYISTIYKGFKEFQQKDDTNNINHIFVFYDITDCIQYFKKEDRALAIIDEIVFKQKINNDTIVPLYFHFFKENSELLNMKTGEIKIPYPFQLYMCKKESEDTLTVVQKGDELRVIEHNVFGPSYIFTTEPFGENPIRFSCFIIKSIYYLQDIKEEPLGVMNEDEESKILEPTVVQKHTEEQKVIQQEEIISNQNIEKDIEKKEGGNTTDEENIDNQDFLYIPTIYYWENGIQYWCIRNNNHFTIIDS